MKTGSEKIRLLGNRVERFPSIPRALIPQDVRTLNQAEFDTLFWFLSELMLADEQLRHTEPGYPFTDGLIDADFGEEDMKFALGTFPASIPRTDKIFRLCEMFRRLEEIGYLPYFHFDWDNKAKEDVLNIPTNLNIPAFYRLWDILSNEKSRRLSDEEGPHVFRKARFDDVSSVLFFDGHDNVLVFRRKGGNKLVLLKAAFSGIYSTEDWIDAADPLLSSYEFSIGNRLYQAAYGVNQDLKKRQLPELFEIDGNGENTKVRRKL